METQVLTQPKKSGLDLVSCPECHAVAVVEWRDVAGGSDGPVEMLKIRCLNRHWFLMPGEALTSR